MNWIALLLFVPPFVDGLKTFGKLEYHQCTSVTREKCVLPQYPEHGSYVVINQTTAGPGDAFDDVALVEYTSDEYFVLEIVYLACVRGAWSREILKRVPRPIESDVWSCVTNQGANTNRNTDPECCKLPPYPEHGLYVVADDASAKPGDELVSASLEYACLEGYDLVGKGHVRCESGTWYDDAPRCLNTTEILGDGIQNITWLSTLNISDICVLPAYPEHGQYNVLEQPPAGPGDNGTFFKLYYWCQIGYGLVGDETVNCSNGVWSDELPTCIGGCRLEYKTGVFYSCKKWRSAEFSTACQPYEPNGAEVLPVCDVPYYSSSEVLPPMKCVDGNWNYTPECLPECGIKVDIKGRRIRRQISSIPFVSEGRLAKSREMPWHVGIYDKAYRPYMQICGGSIVSAAVVLTAAHCFWSDLEGVAPSSRFAVAAGKLWRPWSAPSDYVSQSTDVDRIVIPKRFRGIQTNFQDDIAIVYLSKPFFLNMDVWPVCVDFDLKLDRLQLTAGNLGKVAGWGFLDENGKMSPELQVVQLPYVEIDQCIANASPDFRVYITSDKICAGYTNGTALCKGDSGGGLVFAKQERRFRRYYLKGIASTAPNNDKKCNTHAVPTFTHILAHEHFIEEHLNLTIV